MLTEVAAELDPTALFADLATARGLLLAVSGGPDSTALLLLIDRWRKGAGVPVAIATVDHRLRLDSTSEAVQVAALCAARGLPHHTLVWDNAGIETRVQERARTARYDLLVACAKDIGADTLVTAHHADDQAETILMRLTRGSGIAGLAGMAASSGRDGLTLARPLLGVTKAALVDVCMAEGVVFSDDPSNADAKYRRAALRNLVPVIASEGLDGPALLRLGRRAAQTEAALMWALGRAQTETIVAREARYSELDADAFRALPTELARRILASEFTRITVDAAPRLEQLEALTAQLAHAIADAAPFAATLAGCTVKWRPDLSGAHSAPITIEEAPPRRTG